MDSLQLSVVSCGSLRDLCGSVTYLPHWLRQPAAVLRQRAATSALSPCPLLVTGTVADAGLDSYQYHWGNPTLGSAHGDELVAFFTGTQVLDPLDEALAVAMREYWTSFVTSGTPVAVDSIAWPMAGNSGGSPRILLHPGDISVEEVDDSLEERCEFWRGLTGIETTMPTCGCAARPPALLWTIPNIASFIA
ncbi:hypothetical protein C8J57DRAFT_1540830 [Mycena rebaudengoi]|nr:hypothetical protein C8J57DRAFT_1540830 [Mycena rebaudengoi]